MNNENDYSSAIYTKNNVAELKLIPVVENPQLYIYVMENSPQKNIKIGKTTNIQQRLCSLSGSNGGGNKIVKLYVSPMTYIPTLEETCHNHFDRYRIQGTEWFDGSKVTFDEVVKYVNDLFYTDGYELCNELRKKSATITE